MTRVRALSGLAGSAELWDTVAGLVAERLPGATMTVAPVPWDANGPQDWAHPGWDPLEVLGRVVVPGEILVAHSLAASYVLAHLCDPSRVQPAGVVLVSPFYRPRAEDFSWATLEHFLTRFHTFLETGLVARSRRVIDPGVREDMARAVRDRTGAYGWTAFMSAYLATPSFDTAVVSVPVSVVYGTRDGVAPPQDAVALSHALPDAALYRVAGADHFPMTADPAVVADAIVHTAQRAALPALTAPRS